MTDEQRSKILFHPDAASRFNERAREILNGVGSFERVEPLSVAPTKFIRLSRYQHPTSSGK
jgi:hypothetical protein